jgi:hypothetical protein
MDAKIIPQFKDILKKLEDSKWHYKN